MGNWIETQLPALLGPAALRGSWRMLCASLALGAVAVEGGADGAGQLLQPGAYTVTFRLELPHLESFSETRQAAICVVAPESNPTQGLGAVSDNNPLASCAAAELRRGSDGTLTFDIACGAVGSDGARGSAVYRLGNDRFSGRIAMKMGGKNMTMTEIQDGVRSGACPREPRAPLR
jgi:hypothetical protein